MSTESIKRIKRAFGWDDAVCKYCGQPATMSFKEEYACQEHRDTLLKEKWTL